MNLKQAIKQLKKTNKELKECINPDAKKGKIIKLVPKETDPKNKKIIKEKTK